MTVWPNGSRSKPTSTSGWGYYDPYGTGELVFHYGDDEVGFDWNCAPETGTIVYAEFNGPAGNDIRLQSDRDGTIFRMLHNAHLDGVYVGRRYNEGDQIAPQGATSTERIGRHTHFEVWPGGNINNRTDPVPWMHARVGSSAAGSNSTPFIEPVLSEGNNMAIVLLKASTAGKAQAGGGLFALYDPSAVEPAARWQEFSEIGLARQLVDALHIRRKNLEEASSIVFPDYAWDVWKKRALGIA